MPNENLNALNKRLNVLDDLISNYENDHPRFKNIYDENQEIQSLKNSLKSMLDEITLINQQIQHEYSEMSNIQAYLASESISQSNALETLQTKNEVIDKKIKSIELIKHEIYQIQAKIKIINSNEYQEYLSAREKRQDLISSIKQHEKNGRSDNINNSQNIIDKNLSQFSAVQSQRSKNGRTLLSKANLISNIYENINSDWSSALCKKYNLDVSVIDKDTNIRFVSKTDQSVIDVKKHSVSANSKSENYSTVIDAMIEIYLKSVEGKNIFSHSVDSSDPVAKNLMEQMLANKLRKIGIIDNKINGKSIDQILTKNNDHPLSVEKEQTSSPSPKF